MNLDSRIEKLEAAARSERVRVPVELLTDAELEEMVRKSGYDLSLLTKAELNELRDCYDDEGSYNGATFSPALAAALERVKL